MKKVKDKVVVGGGSSWNRGRIYNLTQSTETEGEKGGGVKV